MSRRQPPTPPAPRAIRWIPAGPGVYPRADIARPAQDLVLVHGAVIGIGEPLGENAPAISSEFAEALIEAGHAELCDVPTEDAVSVEEKAPEE